jgi:hypothetical protein
LGFSFIFSSLLPWATLAPDSFESKVSPILSLGNLTTYVHSFFRVSDPLCLSSSLALHFFRLFFLGPPPC